MLPDEREIRKIVLRNAYMHDGKADLGSVINKIMGQYPEARSKGKEISALVSSLVKDVNSTDPKKVMEEALSELPELGVKVKNVQEHRLPDLSGVTGEVRMRLAPSPSGPLHVGHSRMAILNDEYVRRYGGKLFLRIEDTNPANIDIDAYKLIPEDLEWLEVKVHEIVVQSKRMSIYYKEAKKLIESGSMYICECEQSAFKNYKLHSEACPHRERSPEENLDKFEKMISGEFSKGTVSAVVKTDLNHPNPSIRDWIAFRVKEETHPLTGKTYFAYPMMNFSVAVDDHYLDLTHVIRGKDNLTNTEKQSYIFEYMGWKKPNYYHYGIVHIPGTILKTSIIKKGIRDGTYSGWSDIRLGTLLTMKMRGYRPETFRKYWVASGMREIDSEFSWEIFNSINREIIDPGARRLWFVPNPVKLKIQGGIDLKSNAPFHPGNPALGDRTYNLGTDPDVFIPGKDWVFIQENERFRLKDLCNVIRTPTGIRYSDNSHDDLKKVKIVQWSPSGSSDYKVEKPDGTVDTGKIEPLFSEVKGVSQFERYGYVNMDPGKNVGYFLH